MPPTISPVTSVITSQSTVPSTTNARRTVKGHRCQQCHKLFARRALAEGCENRDNKVQPFHCTKKCGDPN
ncbi:hypothetical protein CPB86DRAFT_748148, partial [Serendipita vermifera]